MENKSLLERLKEYGADRWDAIKHPSRLLQEQSEMLNADPVGYLSGFAGSISPISLPKKFLTKAAEDVVGGLKVYKYRPDLKDIRVTYGQETPTYQPNSALSRSADRPSFIKDRNLPDRETINVDPGQSEKAAIFDGLLAAIRQRKQFGK